MRADIIKHAMQYGLYLGLILGAKFFLAMTQSAFLSFFAMIMWLAIPFFIYLIVRKYRDEQLGGFMSFHEGWSLSFWIIFFGGMILEVIQFIYFQFINTTYLPDILQQTTQMMDKMNLSMPHQNLNIMEKIMTHPNLYVLTDFIMYTIISGAILSLIIAAFVKRKANPFQ